MDMHETIAAISTPAGHGGIGIVRISGPEAFLVASRIFSGKKDILAMPGNTLGFGRVVDNTSGEVIDDVIISRMDKPRSYTGENTVEINCHGSPVVLRHVLELAVRNGARLAGPGEFTKQAFLNGKIDLSQAEAVADLISSMTRLGAKTAVEQLEGKLSKKISYQKSILIELIARIEASIDYPEHDTDDMTAQEVYDALPAIRSGLESLSAGFDKGRIIREGLRLVIVGRPNAGKSSLFNELAGNDRAIVASTPGTTRDTIDEYIDLSGIPVKVTDTAGIRDTGEHIEKLGVDRTFKALDSADMAVFMMDAQLGLSSEDFEMLGLVRQRLPSVAAGHTNIIVLVNKIDLLDERERNALISQICSKVNAPYAEIPVIGTSMKDGTGIDELLKTMDGLFPVGTGDTTALPILIGLRHKTLIDSAICSINTALKSYESGMPLDCMTIDIRQAVDSLAAVTGENVDEEIIDRIFERFCIGK